MKRSLLLLSLLAICIAAPDGWAGQVALHGFNFPQATFGKVPGVNGKDYLWQSPADVDAYAKIGANVFRVPFLWERMQPALYQPFDPQQLKALDALVAAGARDKALIVLDVHNYGAYQGKLIGSPEVPVAAFTDLWTRLARHYTGNPAVAFGLMNEPYKQAADEWAGIAQAGIDAIRKTGARQMILVPGTRYSGAHSWMAGTPSNAQALAGIRDPADDIVFEAHQYLDQDSSGMHPDCVSADIGAQRLADFTRWLKQGNRKGFLGEFGASSDATCLAALKGMLGYMAANADVWRGWTYWAAAPWFGNYMFNVYPPDPAKFPQLPILMNAMHGGGA